MADGDSNLLAIAARPFLVVVSVLEGLVSGLHSHLLDDSLILPSHQRKSQNPALASLALAPCQNRHYHQIADRSCVR
jgi:hypothetical protein